MRRRTRTLSPDDLASFVMNMRWFANRGRITWTRLPSGSYRVKAPATAWSSWVG